MKNSDPIDDTACRQVCQRVVQELIERYGWALLQADDLTELVLGSVQPTASSAEIERQAKHHYTITLYEACLQDKDPPRRERAYRELFRYLYRAAYNRWPELAEDATQRALLLVYEQIERCRHPGAFLAFALWKLKHAFQQEQQARDNDPHPDEVLRSNTERKRATVQLRLSRKERLEVLVEAIRRLPDERKQKTIVLKYFAGLSDEEISVRLGTTVGNVRVLRHRGVARLQKDEKLKEYFEVANSNET